MRRLGGTGGPRLSSLWGNQVGKALSRERFKWVCDELLSFPCTVLGIGR